MAVKKTTKESTRKAPVAAEVTEKEIEIKEKEKLPEGEYFYAVGKRKTSIAQVRFYPISKAAHPIMINGRKLNDYFAEDKMQNTVKAPLVATGRDARAGVFVKVNGGGIAGQAEAVRLGIARALVKYDNTLKKTLRDLGFMTRDARVVERKKPGLKKARRAPQWAKR